MSADCRFCAGSIKDPEVASEISCVNAHLTPMERSRPRLATPSPRPTRAGWRSARLLRLQARRAPGTPSSACPPAAHPGEQLALVGMGAEPRRRLSIDARTRMGSPNIRTSGHLVKQLAAERILGLIAGNEHGIAGILDVVAQVMQDAARLTHAGGGDDHEGAVEVVQLFRFAGLLDVLEAAEAEGIMPWCRYSRAWSLKHSGWLRNTWVTLMARGLSTKIGILGMRFSLAAGGAGGRAAGRGPRRMRGR